MKSEILVFPAEAGECQRVQVVHLDNWNDLQPFSPEPSPNAFSQFCDIYRNYLVPACPWIFGSLILFQLPVQQAEEYCEVKGLGQLVRPEIRAAEILRRGVTVRRGKPIFRSKEAEALWNRLEAQGKLQVICGKLPTTQVIPVANRAGLMTESEQTAAMKVNSSFFIMDCFDCATPYDCVGVPFGLEVMNGVVTRPPLYEREALLVYKDGRIEVAMPKLESVTVEIGSMLFRHGENAGFYTRPGRTRTPGGGVDYVVVGNRVEAIRKGGRTPIPASGFVLKTREPLQTRPGETVLYHGMEQVAFGIQVGNSVVRSGLASERFYSRFFNIRHPWETPYPPSLYPLNYEKSRAARMALGADDTGKPMLVWAEGAAKLGHQPGVDSCGASLSEFSAICARVGMVNGVNLDGGGSAQLLLQNKRQLMISDRKKETCGEAERSVPAGFLVR